ncbi:hypothetical protein [Aliiroseovarius sp. YM-037]|uniref:hypothetical protein n=1 Tax=Aliiroseovarius sp. YM-037 TaxID=3341728 RepID=UPI003A807D79
MTDTSDAAGPDILARIRPSQPRRIVTLCILLSLGVLVILIAFLRPPPEFHWRILLLLFGGVVIWFADLLRRATLKSLILTKDDLRDSNGRLLVRVEDIVSIDRGVFAIKPSNGFMLKTATSMDRAWAPGVWWRIGNRIGVGGVTPAGEAKSMAEIITVMLAQRG